LKVADSDELCKNKQLQITWINILNTSFLLLTLILPGQSGISGLISIRKINERSTPENRALPVPYPGAGIYGNNYQLLRSQYCGRDGPDSPVDVRMVK
jgi:hypothetical protein